MAKEIPNSPPPLVLTRRLAADSALEQADSALEQAGSALEQSGGYASLRLALAAEERTRLRGRRDSCCGRQLLLQLPRGEALRPGEWLAPDRGGPWVRVEAAPEALLVVRAASPLALLQAAYHLGNRHVALELREQELRLSEDPVLADLLARRGLSLERRHAPFLPEPGAYAGLGEGHAHSHSHAHSQSHAHSPGEGDDPSPGHPHAHSQGLSPRQGPAHDPAPRPDDPGHSPVFDPSGDPSSAPRRLPNGANADHHGGG